MKIIFLAVAVFSGVLVLVSMWMHQRAYMDARKYFPLQFADELSALYYMQYVLFDRTIPWQIRRRLAISSTLGTTAFAGFAGVAYLLIILSSLCLASDLRLRAGEHRLAVA